MSTDAYGTTVPVVRPLSRALRDRWQLGVLAATLAALGISDGGYFPTAWGLGGIAFAWMTIWILFTRGSWEWSTMEWCLVASLLAITLLNVPRAGAEDFARLCLFSLGVAAVLLAARRNQAQEVMLVSALAATVVVVVAGLATRLFPERFGVFDSIAGYRLAEPLGYWNALGILSALGVIVALALVAHSAGSTTTAFAGCALPLFAAALYFTFSRGAWIALCIGLLTIAATETRRLAFVWSALTVTSISAVLVAVASRQDALTTVDSDLSAASREGHALAVLILIAMLVSGTVALALRRIRRGWQPTRSTRRSGAIALVVFAGLLAAGISGRQGAPWTIASNAYDSFTSPPPRVQNLNERLFTFSSNGRIELWEAAWNNYKDHPLTGSGAGTFEQYWLEHRDVGLKVRDAHSLYLETLSELGPLGLALLLLALGVPVYAAFKARGHPLVPAAFGAYVAYLVHAGVDWDWEMPAVTLTALFIGASIVVAARKPEDEERTMSLRLRYGLLAGTLALAAVAFVGLVGNMALAQSADAARAGDWGESESKARRAATWAPWSPEPWQKIGEAQLARGELAAAQDSFRKAIAKDERDWELWLDLARASEGPALERALAEATRLNPLSPEVAQLRKELAELGTIEVGG